MSQALSIIADWIRKLPDIILFIVFITWIIYVGYRIYKIYKAASGTE